MVRNINEETRNNEVSCVTQLYFPQKILTCMTINAARDCEHMGQI